MTEVTTGGAWQLRASEKRNKKSTILCIFIKRQPHLMRLWSTWAPSQWPLRWITLLLSQQSVYWKGISVIPRISFFLCLFLKIRIDHLWGHTKLFSVATTASLNGRDAATCQSLSGPGSARKGFQKWCRQPECSWAISNPNGCDWKLILFILDVLRFFQTYWTRLPTVTNTIVKKNTHDHKFPRKERFRSAGATDGQNVDLTIMLRKQKFRCMRVQALLKTDSGDESKFFRSKLTVMEGIPRIFLPFFFQCWNPN